MSWRRTLRRSLYVVYLAGYKYVPFIHPTLVRHLLDHKCGSILDVGCGQGLVMAVVNRNKHFFAVGVDIFDPYLCECKEKGVFDTLVKADIRRLPFSSKSFDTVICSRVLEYLNKEDGTEVINRLEQVARKQVILVIIHGYWNEHSCNPWQVQRSRWCPEEMRGMGYRVLGVGPRFLEPKFVWRQFFYVLGSVLMGPLLYCIPKLARYMVCVKRL